MATSGSKSVAVTSYDTLKFSWSRTSYSVEKNTSTISWKMELISTSAGRISSSASKKWSVTVNGTSYSGTNSIAIANNATKTLASGSTTIAHNADGTKTFSYSFSQTFDITFSGKSIGTKSGSSTGTLDTIPRASTVTATSAVVGSDSTITINRATSSFTHDITWACGDVSGTIATKTANTSITWTLPTSLYAEIGAEATSATVTITCTTYNGSTQIGSATTCTLTAKTSEATCAPVVKGTVKDVNSTTVALTGSSNKFIKYFSTAEYTITAAARNGATLTSKIVKCGSKGGGTSTNTGKISNIESGEFIFRAIDSRGYSTTETVTKTMVDYIKLTCSFKVNAFVDGTARLVISGNCFNGSFGAADNTLTVQYRYKVSGGTYSNWTTATATKSGNKYSVDTIATGLDYKQAYTFQVKATDKLMTVTPDTKSAKALPIFDWGENDFNFNVAVRCQENIIMKNGGIGVRGTTTTGEDVQSFAPCNANNNCVVGYGGYDLGIGGTNLYGNTVKIITNDKVTINNGTVYGEFVLYDNESGEAGAVTLSNSASDYTYLEIYYEDNNLDGAGYTKVYKPDGKAVDLSLVEASPSGTTYIRRTAYDISGKTITPVADGMGFVTVNKANAWSNTLGTNYLRITRVVGYK